MARRTASGRSALNGRKGEVHVIGMEYICDRLLHIARMKQAQFEIFAVSRSCLCLVMRVCVVLMHSIRLKLSYLGETL